MTTLRPAALMLALFATTLLSNATATPVGAGAEIAVMDFMFGVAPYTNGPRAGVLVILNAGGEELVVDAITIKGSNAFRLTDPFDAPVTIGAGEETTIGITFDPQGAGQYSATVDVLSNATSGRSRATISGIATGLSVTASNYSFGTAPVEIDSSRIGYVTIINEGDESIRVLGILSMSGDTSMFRLLNPDAAVDRTIGAGQHVKLDIRYEPSVAGPHAMTIHWQTEPQLELVSTVDGEATAPIVASIVSESVGRSAIEHLAPNPVSTGTVVLRLRPGHRAAMASLVNSVGEVVRRWDVQDDARPVSLDIDGVAAGAYLVRIEGESGVSTRTLTVVR